MLIEQPECPKGDLVPIAVFDVILDDIGICHIFNLSLPFLFATDLKSVFAYFEIFTFPNKLMPCVSLRNTLISPALASHIIRPSTFRPATSCIFLAAISWKMVLCCKYENRHKNESVFVKSAVYFWRFCWFVSFVPNVSR